MCVMIDILTMFLKLRLCNKLLFDKRLTLATLLKIQVIII